jgi:hypothetical protein
MKKEENRVIIYEKADSIWGNGSFCLTREHIIKWYEAPDRWPPYTAIWGH